MSKHIGSVEKGKLADLVLWKPAFFGVKPEMIIKGGMIAWALMGDPNASIPTPQPVHYRPMFGSMALAHGSALTFMSDAALRRASSASSRCKAPGRGKEHARQDRQEEHDPQWRDAEDRHRPRDL